MMTFTLHAQLAADCYKLGTINDCTLLLHKNALVPWFILVPHTNKTEIFKLDQSVQLQLQNNINLIANFVDQHFNADKLNIATIGNIVPQLHIHIIGRFKNDFCWPSPVWGQQKSTQYHEKNLNTLKLAISHKLHNLITH